MEGTLSGGKKWASGTVTSSSSTTTFSYSSTTSTSTVSTRYVDIALNFTPSVIIASYYYGNYEYLTVLNSLGAVHTAKNVKASVYNSANYNSNSYNIKNDSKVSLGNNIYRLPIIYSSSVTVTWYAYE